MLKDKPIKRNTILESAVPTMFVRTAEETFKMGKSLFRDRFKDNQCVLQRFIINTATDLQQSKVSRYIYRYTSHSEL